MRVLELIPDLRIGGAERLTVTLATELRGQGADVEVISFYPALGTFLEEELERRNIPLLCLSKQLGFRPGFFRELAKAIARCGPDVIHTHIHALRYAWPFAGDRRGKGRVGVHTLHSLAMAETDLTGRFERRLALQLGWKLVGCGEEVARSARRLYRTERIEVIPNAVSGGPFLRAPVPRPRRGRIRLISIGSLVPNKNPELLLRAFAWAQAKVPEFVLSFVGTGALETSLRAVADALGVSRVVEFLGSRSDIAELLADADVFAMSSRHEGLPLALIEAMLSGLPAVATAVGGITDLVCDGETGFLVPEGDGVELAHSLVRLGTDAGLRMELGRRARAVALARSDAGGMARSYLNLFSSILSG